MTSSFVTLPLEKLLNRENFISRLEKVETLYTAGPSARVGRLSEFSQDAGDIVAGRFLVFNADTGELEVALDDDGLALSLPTDYTTLNTIRWSDGVTDLINLRGKKDTPNTLIELNTDITRQTGYNSRMLLHADAPSGKHAYIQLITGLNGGLGNYLEVSSSDGVSVSGPFRCDSITNDTGLAHGTWTPTATAGTNISASTDIAPFDFNYLRVGNQVHFNGFINIDTTAIGAFTCYLSLPIASNFTAVSDANGCGTQPGTGTPSIISIREDQTNDRLQLDGYAQSAAVLSYRLSGGYIVK